MPQMKDPSPDSGALSDPGAQGMEVFEVDPERAQQVIELANQALAELDAIADEASRLGRVAPPGLDPHSENAADVFSRQASAEVGRHGWANHEFEQALLSVRDGVRAVLRNYEQTEEATEQGLR